jgi:hypothetical protein
LRATLAIRVVGSKEQELYAKLKGHLLMALAPESAAAVPLETTAASAGLSLRRGPPPKAMHAPPPWGRSRIPGERTARRDARYPAAGVAALPVGYWASEVPGEDPSGRIWPRPTPQEGWGSFAVATGWAVILTTQVTFWTLYWTAVVLGPLLAATPLLLRSLPSDSDTDWSTKARSFLRVPIGSVDPDQLRSAVAAAFAAAVPSAHGATTPEGARWCVADAGQRTTLVAWPGVEGDPVLELRSVREARSVADVKGRIEAALFKVAASA